MLAGYFPVNSFVLRQASLCDSDSQVVCHDDLRNLSDIVSVIIITENLMWVIVTWIHDYLLSSEN